MRWEREGLKVEALDAAAGVAAAGAARAARCKLDHVRAAALRIEDRRPPKPSVVPVSLVIPLRVEIDEAKVGQVQWVAAANSFEASELAGSYSFDGLQHKRAAGQPALGGGSYSRRGELGAHGTLPVDADAGGPVRNAGARQHARSCRWPSRRRCAVRWPTCRRARLLQGHAASPSGDHPRHGHCARDALGGAARAAGAGRVPAAGPGRVVAAGAAHQLAGQVELQPAGTATWALTTRTSQRAARSLGQGAGFRWNRLRASGEWRQIGAGAGAQPGSASWRWAHPGQRPVARRRRLGDGGRARRRQPRRCAQRDGAAAGGWAGRPEGRGRGRGVRRGPQGAGRRVKRRRPAAKGELAAAVRALELREALARGRWADGLLSLAAARGAHGRRGAARRGGVAARRARRQRPRRLKRRGCRRARKASWRKAAATAQCAHRARTWRRRCPGWRVCRVCPPSCASSGCGPRRGASWRGRAAGATRRAGQPGRAAAGAAGNRRGARLGRVRDAAATINGRLSDASVEVRGRAEQGQRRLTAGPGGAGRAALTNTGGVAGAACNAQAVGQ